MPFITLGMTVPFEATGMVPPPPGIHPLPVSRPQVGIERLPARRMSNEPRESMNCKSCRKRKVRDVRVGQTPTMSTLFFRTKTRNDLRLTKGKRTRSNAIVCDHLARLVRFSSALVYMVRLDCTCRSQGPGCRFNSSKPRLTSRRDIIAHRCGAEEKRPKDRCP